LQFFPNFPIFRATFPVFLDIKTSFGLLRTLKKISQIVPAVLIEKSTLNFFQFSGQLFQILFFKPDLGYYKHFKKRIGQIGPGVLK
jgi:hypothetical protein